MTIRAYSSLAAGLSLLALATLQTIEAADIRFPNDFFVDEIRGEACHHHASTSDFDYQWKHISDHWCPNNYSNKINWLEFSRFDKL